jgi:alpha-tubulin suppressor-like RCC1 family protein
MYFLRAAALAIGTLTLACGNSSGTPASHHAGDSDGPVTSDAGDAAMPGEGGGSVDGGILSVSAGFDFSCALRASGLVYCWGANNDGQVGSGSNSSSLDPTPHKVASLTDVTQIVSGEEFSCALKADQTVWCWGLAPNAQVGMLGAPQATPVAVAGLSGVAEIAAGGTDACARKIDGSVCWWGENTNGQLGHDNSGDTVTLVKVPHPHGDDHRPPSSWACPPSR